MDSSSGTDNNRSRDTMMPKESTELPHKSSAITRLSLLFTGEYADATVKCQEHEWRVHRSILCTRSSYFKACLDGGYQEAHTATSKLDDDPSFAVEGLLAYLYTLDYPIRTLQHDSENASVALQTIEAEVETELPFTFPTDAVHTSTQGKEEQAEVGWKSTPPTYAWQYHLALFKLADKVLLSSLAELAATRLAQSCAETAQTPRKFVILLAELWSTSQTGLERARESALNATYLNVTTMLKELSFNDLIQECPFFATKLIEKMAEKKEEMERSRASLKSQLQASQVEGCPWSTDCYRDLFPPPASRPATRFTLGSDSGWETPFGDPLATPQPYSNPSPYFLRAPISWPRRLDYPAIPLFPLAPLPYGVPHNLSSAPPASLNPPVTAATVNSALTQSNAIPGSVATSSSA